MPDSAVADRSVEVGVRGGQGSVDRVAVLGRTRDAVPTKTVGTVLGSHYFVDGLIRWPSILRSASRVVAAEGPVPGKRWRYIRRAVPRRCPGSAQAVACRSSQMVPVATVLL